MDFSWVPAYTGLFLKAFGMTLRLGLIAVVCGTVLGLLVGIVSTTKSRTLKPFRIVLKIYVELLRGCPLLIQLFMVYFGFPYMGINIDISLTTFLVFTLYSGAYIAEIVRSGIESIPSGQWEAGVLPGSELRADHVPDHTSSDCKAGTGIFDWLLYWND